MKTNSGVQLLCAWAGPVLAICFGIGFVVLARFVPPPAPSMSPDQVVAMYREHVGGIRVGMVLCQIGLAMWLPWGISIAVQTSRLERDRHPVMTFAQISSLGVCTALVVLSTVIWEAAAFRAGDISPEITQALNDLAWFVFLWPVVPFSVWLVTIAIPILQDWSPSPIYPRWVAYFSLWVAFMFLPAGVIGFFNAGPFAWNGLLAFYLPVVPFFIWLVIMTALTIKAINEERRLYPHGGTRLMSENAERSLSKT